MPELPEVETTRRGIEPHVLYNTVTQVIVRQPRLRWLVPAELHDLVGQKIQSVVRRAKYLLLETARGTVIIHLGMSGSLRICAVDTPAAKHDHVDLVFANQAVLRLRDPRRFGAVLWTADWVQHPLIATLGLEPLTAAFSAAYLYQRARTKRVPSKVFIMDAHVVVGVGNIYANEALFMSGIHPERAANRLDLAACEALVMSIKTVLQQAITQGGTTLRDFVSADGSTGHFQVALQVYGRKGLPCLRCGTVLQSMRLGQRSTWFCPTCQS